jgi:hypothetical protein
MILRLVLLNYRLDIRNLRRCRNLLNALEVIRASSADAAVSR